MVLPDNLRQGLRAQAVSEWLGRPFGEAGCREQVGHGPVLGVIAERDKVPSGGDKK